LYISKYSSRAFSEDDDDPNVKARAFDILTAHLAINESTISRWRRQSEEVPTHRLGMEELIQVASRMPSVDFARASLKVRTMTIECN
jgi:hypothetical protein